MSKTTRRAAIGAVIKLLCDRFPQTFRHHGQRWRPLKVGIYADLMAVLGDSVRSRDLKAALRAYTSTASYLRALSAGAPRVCLDGSLDGAVTSEHEAVATARLAELANRRLVELANNKPAPQHTVQANTLPAAPPGTSSISASSEIPKPSAPPGAKKLSLADLREAGRRRREAAA